MTGIRISNFDTAADFYEYEADSPEVAKEKVEKYAGRIGGGDFKWEFGYRNARYYRFRMRLGIARNRKTVTGLVGNKRHFAFNGTCYFSPLVSTVAVARAVARTSAEGNCFVITVDLAAGSHTVSKGGGENALFLIKLVPAA